MHLEFCMMLALGFFRLTGQHYQMIPPRLTLKRVKEAALTVAGTEDGENGLRPQDLVFRQNNHGRGQQELLHFHSPSSLRFEFASYRTQEVMHAMLAC
jgi:hypothetical protein